MATTTGGAAPKQTLQVGSRVEIAEKGRGTVRFMGPVKFSSKDNWVGIELDAPNGNHDGSVKGVRYFKCNTNHGLFVTKDKVVLLKKVTKPAGAVSIKSPSSSIPPSPASSAPSSPRGEPSSTIASPVPVAAAAAAAAPSTSTSTATSVSTVEAATPTDPAPAPVVVADDSGEKRDHIQPEGLPSEAKANEEAPESKPPTPAAVVTPSPQPTRAPSSTPSTPVSASPSKSVSPRSTPSQAAALSAESAALFTTLQELGDFKKDAQQKLKALQKALDEVSKEKEALAKELDKEKKDREKQIAKIQKKFEDEKEQLQRAWDEEKEEMNEEMANLNDTLEMMTLDKELAEEKTEALEKQLRQIKTKYKIGDLLDDDNDEEDDNSEDDDRPQSGRGGDNEEAAALKLQVQRLTDALMKLKDLSVMEKKESEKRVKQLERENANIPVLEDKIAKLKEDAKKANERIDQLKEQLDDALGAEDMIEELSQKKLELEEQVQELQQAVEDLEQLQQVSEELEENHAEVEKQLRTALYKKEIQFLDSITKIKNQQTEIEDRDKTIDQFREKVNSLQHALKSYEEKEEELASEARQLSTKSQALMDQNIQLKSQITKAVAMGLERELARLDVLQARKHLTFIQAFLPEEILSRDNESLLLLLCLDRILFKANLLMGHLQRYYQLDQLSFNLINDVEIRYDSEELLFAWELYWGVSKIRFYSSGLRKVLHDPNICPPDMFVRAGRAALDLLPYESTMDALLQLLKKEELNHNYDISIFRGVQDKMSKLVEQYIVREESGLTDSNETLPLRRAFKDHGVGILCLPGWKSLRLQVDSILFVENVFLVLYHQLKSLLKGGVSTNEATTVETASSAGQLAIPIRLVRDTIDICRKLHKHLQEKPSLPRHYAFKLERNMQSCYTSIYNAVEVIRQLSAHLRNTVAGQDATTKEKEIRAVLPSLVNSVIKHNESGPDEVDVEKKELAASDEDTSHKADEGAEQSTEDKGKERDESEQAQAVQESESKSDEWKWLSDVLENVHTAIAAVSDKITNSSNFIKPDATIAISPMSSKSSPSSPLPVQESPSSPLLRSADSIPAWKQRAETVRAELAAAASVRAKLLDAETLAQERLVRLNMQENEIKEHISRYNVLQMHLTALQKKEAELTEKMEKQITEHVSQEKMYEDAMETIQKENEQLRQQIRALRVEIRNLENAKKEAEEQRAEMPALEFVSAEIKALKRALVLLRRKNSELLAREGQKRLRTLLPPVFASEEKLSSYLTPLEHQLQQDQDSDDGLLPELTTRNRNKNITTLNKHTAETQQFLEQLQSVKASNKVIDLTLAGADAPAQQWANKRLANTKLEVQLKQLKHKLGGALLESSMAPGEKGSNFASFPSVQLSKTLSQGEAQAVGKLVLPSALDQQRQQPTEVRSQMQDLLAQLKGGNDGRKRVTLTPHQLQRVHSLLL